jgi:hypothetical protein
VQSLLPRQQQVQQQENQQSQPQQPGTPPSSQGSVAPTVSTPTRSPSNSGSFNPSFQPFSDLDEQELPPGAALLSGLGPIVPPNSAAISAAFAAVNNPTGDVLYDDIPIGQAPEPSTSSTSAGAKQAAGGESLDTLVGSSCGWIPADEVRGGPMRI